ncbi:MAG: hypothetical protein IPO01_19620 [Chitinophagaceae bacterium]|nr:hypothetical protein [Chitinophagaceae bacterium]
MLRDDGIVLFINDCEVIRNNTPISTIAYATLASANITQCGREAVSVNLSPAFFSVGVNTIAVEVHLRTTKFDRYVFDMEVRGLSDNGTF